jgi:endonuclease III
MEIFAKVIWGEVVMAISFLGQEICRPTNTKCQICPIGKSCYYYNNINLN